MSPRPGWRPPEGPLSSCPVELKQRSPSAVCFPRDNLVISYQLRSKEVEINPKSHDTREHTATNGLCTSRFPQNLGPQVGTIERQRDFKRQGLVRRSGDHWGCALERNWGSDFSPFLFSSPAHEGGGLVLLYGRLGSLATGTFKTKAQRPSLSSKLPQFFFFYDDDRGGGHIITLHSWDCHTGLLFSSWPQ